jgi:hypothetical protein
LSQEEPEFLQERPPPKKKRRRRREMSLATFGYPTLLYQQ